MYDRLASILKVSIRRRSNIGSLKTACDPLKWPNNVFNMKVPKTYLSITKVKTVGGKLLDTRLSRTNITFFRGLELLAHYISDIEDKAGNYLLPR